MSIQAAARTGCILLLAGLRCWAQDSVPDVLERAMPGVVTVLRVKPGLYSQGAGLAATDIAYSKILDLKGQGGGSGFLIQLEGKPYVVTNAHVIKEAMGGAGSIEVISIDQTHYPMRLAALDSLYDLAVLEFEAGKHGPELKPLEFRTDEVRVGEPVYAIGNPLLEFPYSVSAGIVGGKNRRHPDLTGKFGYIQSTATTTWGNSGGPLIDSKGRVIGVTTKIYLRPQGNQIYQQTQINLALDARIASRLIAEMVANGGRLRRAYLGIEVSEDVDEYEPHLQQTPPMLTGILPDSPALAVLADKRGYRIQRVGRTDVSTVADVLEALEQVRPGQEVVMELSAPKSEKVDTVKIKGAELTDANAAAIAEFAIAKSGPAKLIEKDGAVILRRTVEALNSDAGVVAKRVARPRPVSGSVRSRVPAMAVSFSDLPRESFIIGAGLGDNTTPDHIFRVKALRDLGIAIKITAMSGLVDVLCTTNKNDPDAAPMGMQVLFTNKPGVLRRTLLY